MSAASAIVLMQMIVEWEAVMCFNLSPGLFLCLLDALLKVSRVTWLDMSPSASIMFSLRCISGPHGIVG